MYNHGIATLNLKFFTGGYTNVSRRRVKAKMSADPLQKFETCGEKGQMKHYMMSTDVKQ